MRWLVIAVFSVAATAIAANQAHARYAGYYSSGFEESLFRPVGSTERWWLIGRLSSSCPVSYNYSYIYLEVLGELSSKAKHGHMGIYDRELRVVDTLSCRTISSEESGEL